MDFSTKWKLPRSDHVLARYFTHEICDAYTEEMGSFARVIQATFCIFVGCLQRKICIKQIILLMCVISKKNDIFRYILLWGNVFIIFTVMGACNIVYFFLLKREQIEYINPFWSNAHHFFSFSSTESKYTDAVVLNIFATAFCLLCHNNNTHLEDVTHRR